MLVLDNRVSATGAIAGAVVGNIGAVLATTTKPALHACTAHYLLPAAYYLFLIYLLTTYSTTS